MKRKIYSLILITALCLSACGNKVDTADTVDYIAEDTSDIYDEEKDTKAENVSEADTYSVPDLSYLLHQAKDKYSYAQNFEYKPEEGVPVNYDVAWNDGYAYIYSLGNTVDFAIVGSDDTVYAYYYTCEETYECGLGGSLQYGDTHMQGYFNQLIEKYREGSLTINSSGHYIDSFDDIAIEGSSDTISIVFDLCFDERWKDNQGDWYNEETDRATGYLYSCSIILNSSYEDIETQTTIFAYVSNAFAQDFEGFEYNGMYIDSETQVPAIIGEAGVLYFGEYSTLNAGCSVYCAVNDYNTTATASSVLKPSGDINYSAENATVCDNKAAWIEGVSGYGIGESIEIVREIDLPEGNTNPIDFTNICIVNGYAKNIETWNKNSRVKTLKFYCNDKYICDISLKDDYRPQNFDLAEYDLHAASGDKTKFKFEIADIYAGDLYDDTALTGISIEFWTPNH